jgi:hypothetical protein
MIPLTGQILKTGHLMQPTASATGQSVMITLPSKSAAACTPPSVARYSPRTRGVTFHATAGPLASSPAASQSLRPGERLYPDMKKNPDASLTIHLQNKTLGKDKEANWLRCLRDRCPLPGQRAVIHLDFLDFRLADGRLGPNAGYAPCYAVPPGAVYVFRSALCTETALRHDRDRSMPADQRLRGPSNGLRVRHERPT